MRIWQHLSIFPQSLDFVAKTITLFFLFFSLNQAISQTFTNERFGASVGLFFNVGTTVNRIGFTGAGYYLSDFVQLNLQLRGNYNITTYGPRPAIHGWEFVGSLGAVLGFGPPTPIDHSFLSPISNQTTRFYAVAYAYNVYFDQMETSERSGTIGLHIHRFSLATENDALSGELSDRFRTGGLLLSYRTDETEWSINTLLWTGDAQSEGVQKITETQYPSRYGYKDLSEGKYGKFSHGILTAQVKQQLPYGQFAQANIGIDSEWVRHVFQNKLIHDMYFIPKGWVKVRNPHYPMLDTEGKPYLFLPSQKVKKSRFYMNVGMNQGLFY